MKRRIPFIILLFLLAAKSRAATISPEVLDAVARGERVHVIVALRTAARFDARAFRVTRRWRSADAIAGELSIDTLNELANDRQVVRVDVDRVWKPLLTLSVPLVGATPLHESGVTGEGITVAIVDTGVSATHPDLAGAVTDEHCFCSDANGNGCCPNHQTTQSGAGAAADDYGHGTHVAGIVASRRVVAGVGMAPGASIVAVRVTDANGQYAHSSQVISALDWIINEHPEVRVVNVSLGDGVPVSHTCDHDSADTMVVAEQVAKLRARGTPVVVSSGNDASADGLSTPACLSGVWSVGAVYSADFGSARWPEPHCIDRTPAADRIACFSDSAPFLTFLAPGAIITSDQPGGGIKERSGTSMAAPHVAGAVALLLQIKPSAGVDELQSTLTTSGKLITDSRNGVVTPRIDVGKAAAELREPHARQRVVRR
ncbi:MAG TPA: S8 family serine peptidase [Thermoanaerobaculia bacterium]|nr:S8 family serine peptidase [Thermoanaerobaculia bacterium]